MNAFLYFDALKLNMDRDNIDKENIELWEDEDGWWIISHKEINVTTQGKTRLHALLMLADAIAAVKDSDEDLMALSEDVFIPDEEMLEFIDKLKDENIDD